MSEFEVPQTENTSLEKYQFHWLYTNGLLGIIFTCGLLYTALKSRKARSWLYGTGLSMEQRFILSCNYSQEQPNHICKLSVSIGWLRSFIADYGVPLMVVVWTALSFSVPSKVPFGVPRRLQSPLAWQSTSLHHWTVVKVNPLPLGIIV